MTKLSKFLLAGLILFLSYLILYEDPKESKYDITIKELPEASTATESETLSQLIMNKNNAERFDLWARDNAKYHNVDVDEIELLNPSEAISDVILDASKSGTTLIPINDQSWEYLAVSMENNGEYTITLHDPYRFYGDANSGSYSDSIIDILPVRIAYKRRAKP